MSINIEKSKLKHQIPPQTKTLTYDSVESQSVSFGQLYKIPYLLFLFSSSLSWDSCHTVVPLDKIQVRFRIDFVFQHFYSAKRKKVNKKLKIITSCCSLLSYVLICIIFYPCVFLKLHLYNIFSIHHFAYR